MQDLKFTIHSALHCEFSVLRDSISFNPYQKMNIFYNLFLSITGCLHITAILQGTYVLYVLVNFSLTAYLKLCIDNIYSARWKQFLMLQRTTAD